MEQFTEGESTREEIKNKLRQNFDGKIVRKDLTKKIKEGANVPVYVLEFLLGQYCSSDDETVIEKGVQKVKQILAANFVRPDESQKILSQLRKKGSHTIIDMVTVRLDMKKDCFFAEFSNLGVGNVPIADEYPEKFDRLLCGGIWCIVQLDYEVDNNCCSMQSLKKETFEFFKKVAGYDTLRLILCKKSILVEGDSDELVVQRAYMDTHEGRLPIQDGIDVMTVRGVTFKRYLEIARILNKETAVVTDNDGNIEAVKKKYKEYEKIPFIHICVDEVVDTGDLKLSDKDFNYNTLEPKILKENGLEVMNNIFGTKYDTDDEMHRYMYAHKTDCAIAIFESATKIKYPEYIMRALKNE